MQRGENENDLNTLFMLELIEWNLVHNLTQDSFTDLLKVLKTSLPHYFPEGTLPTNFQQAISHFQTFGLPSKKVDMCVNGCCRFDGENAMCSKCPKCKADRWDPKMLMKPVSKRVGLTTVYYWDMKDLLRRMYAHPELSVDMRAHARHVPCKPGEPMEYMWGAL